MEESRENVLVAGANGKTGRKVVQLLKESQYFNPVAMVREESQLEQFEKEDIDTVLGDLEEDLAHVIKGIDKVVFAAGSGGETSDKKTLLVDQEGAKRLIDVAKMANVKKFVMLSAMHADKPESYEGLEHYLKAKKEADEHLKESGLNYAIVRPGGLTDEEGTGKIKASIKLDESGKISRQDVASTLVHVLNDTAANKSVFEILKGDTLIEKAIKQV